MFFFTLKVVFIVGDWCICTILFFIKSCIYRWRLVYMHYFYFSLKVVFIGGDCCICIYMQYFYFTLKVKFVGGDWCICTIFIFH